DLVQQDGRAAPPGLRPDERTALRHFDGQLRQRRRLLPLLLLGGARLRPDRAGRHLRSRLPADRRSPALRDSPAAAENPPRRDDRTVSVALHVPRTASDEGVIDAATKALGDALLGVKEHVGEITLTVKRDEIVNVLKKLRDTAGLEYQQLMEMAGVDYPDRAERFEVVYQLLSLTRNRRLRVKVSTDEATPVPSVTALWPVAGWLEREVYDMYGVTFAGNPDLRRILTDYGFEGYPQRKDF